MFCLGLCFSFGLEMFMPYLIRRNCLFKCYRLPPLRCSSLFNLFHLPVSDFNMAHEQQQFFLKWNEFQSNMVSSFKHLRDEKSFTDVTLACEGQTCKAHKMVLSACSPYFKTLLEENPSKHPIIILKDVPFSHLQSILEFMYAGEVNVSEEQLSAFLKTAERLKVKGLAEAPQAIKRE